MKFYDILLFLFILNALGTFFTSIAPTLGYSEYLYLNPENAQTTATNLEQTYQSGISQEAMSGADPFQQGFGLLYLAVQTVWNGIKTIFINYIFWLPFLLISFNVPPAFAWGLQVILLFVQIIGFAQLITGRSLGAVE